MYETQLVKEDNMQDQHEYANLEETELEEDLKRAKAFSLYNIMEENFFLWKRGHVGDKKSYADMINAAIGLCKLHMPNPFAEPKHTANAATRPGKGRVVTGVTEESK